MTLGELIQAARDIDAEGFEEARVDIFGNEQETLAALEVIAGVSGEDDRLGDVDGFGHYYRVDRWIVSTDTQGFQDVAEFATEDEARATWARIEAEFEEFEGPQDGDAVMSSNGFVLSVSFDGKFLGEFVEDDEARAAIRAEMNRTNYWPNVWTVSDHGNAELISREFYAETEALKSASN